MQYRVMAIAAVLALGFGPAHANETFKDWWVTCDNTRECAAFGFAGQAFEMGGYLKVARGAGAQDAPAARIVMEGKAGTWSLAVDGRPLANVEAKDAGEERAAADLTAAQAKALIAAAAGGKALQVSAGGEPLGVVSLAGSSAALRWMDDQQKRAGSVTALVAKGASPASAVPPAPPPPLVQAAPPVAQAKLAAKLPRAVRVLMKDCDDDIARLKVEPISGQLSPGLTLWAPLCTRGAYNLSHSFFVVDETGAARPLPIRYSDTVEPTVDLINVSYDAVTQTLSNFEKGRGLGDCGATNTWVWDGEAFVPTSQTLMSECRGVPPEDWPVSYRTRAK